MERLTKLARDGTKYVPALDFGYEAWRRIVERLAAYENTGLEPGEIEILCEMDRRARMADMLRLEEYERLGSVEDIREAFREVVNKEENAPLTLEELKGMDGEPVWIVWPDGRIKSKWWIVGNYDWRMMEFDDPYTRNDYGKTWIAYRYPPEEIEA